MKVLSHLLLGWGMIAVTAFGSVSAVGSRHSSENVPLDLSEMWADADMLCPKSLVSEAIVDRARKADVRVIVLDEIRQHRELYTSYMHAMERDIFVLAVHGLSHIAPALKWANKNGLTFETVFTAGVFPERGEGSSATSKRDWSTPSGEPVFNVIPEIRRLSPQSRIVVVSVWDESSVMSYYRSLYRRAPSDLPDAWRVVNGTKEQLQSEVR